MALKGGSYDGGPSPITPKSAQGLGVHLPAVRLSVQTQVAETQ